MYKPDIEKIKKYAYSDDGTGNIDWHAWLRELLPSEVKELEKEILDAISREELSQYARQYYLHLCIDSNDARARDIERDFVHAQLDNKPQEEISEIEDRYFQYAKELLRMQENRDEN